MKHSESKGKMMLHTVAQTSFSPGELRLLLRWQRDWEHCPYPGCSLSRRRRQNSLVPLTPNKISGTTRCSRDSRSCLFCLWCLPASLIHLSLLQKVIRINIRLTEASQLLAVLMRKVHPMEQRGMGLGP